jgi:cysteine dioxygenase
MEFLACVKEVLSKVKQPGYRELKEAIKLIGCTREKILPYVTEPDQFSYGRNVIYRSDRVEAIVIHIPGMKQTPIHNHGNSIGCGQVVEGNLINQLYVLEKDDEPFGYEENRFAQGQFFFATKGQIHQMRNPSAERLITFHIYSPPLQDMKIYK